MRMQAAVESLIEERRTRWTRARFDRIAESGGFEGVRVELVQGELVDMSPQGVPHAEVIERLNELLMPKLIGHARVRIQLPFVIDDETELIPDVAVVSRSARRGEHPTQALLVIEVADSSERYDRLVKAPVYAKAKVNMYWLVNVSDWSVTMYSRANKGEYEKERTITTGDLAIPGLAQVKITVADIFA